MHYNHSFTNCPGNLPPAFENRFVRSPRPDTRPHSVFNDASYVPPHGYSVSNFSPGARTAEGINNNPYIPSPFPPYIGGVNYRRYVPNRDMLENVSAQSIGNIPPTYHDDPCIFTYVPNKVVSQRNFPAKRIHNHHQKKCHPNFVPTHVPTTVMLRNGRIPAQCIDNDPLSNYYDLSTFTNDVPSILSPEARFPTKITDNNHQKKYYDPNFVPSHVKITEVSVIKQDSKHGTLKCSIAAEQNHAIGKYYSSVEDSEDNIDETKTSAVNWSATEETNFRTSIYKDENEIEDVRAVLPFDSGDVSSSTQQEDDLSTTQQEEDLSSTQQEDDGEDKTCKKIENQNSKMQSCEVVLYNILDNTNVNNEPHVHEVKPDENAFEKNVKRKRKASSKPKYARTKKSKTKREKKLAVKNTSKRSETITSAASQDSVYRNDGIYPDKTSLTKRKFGNYRLKEDMTPWWK